jgi:hypothetical protein
MKKPFSDPNAVRAPNGMECIDMLLGGHQLNLLNDLSVTIINKKEGDFTP